MKKYRLILFLTLALLLVSCADARVDQPQPDLLPEPETSTSPTVAAEPTDPITSAAETTSETAVETMPETLPETMPETAAEEQDPFADDDGFSFCMPEDLADEDLLYQLNAESEPAEELLKILYDETATPDERLYDFVADDFDLDGNYEAFAVKGLQDGWEIKGDIYYITKNGVEKINPDTYYLETERYPVFDLKDRKLYRVWHVFTTGRSAYVYGVKDGKWYEHSISQVGQELERIGKSDNFTIVNGSDYDMGYSPGDHFTTGHTWKTYYLYWNGEEFREYGGIEISEEEFLELDGAEHVLELAKADGRFISGILYRANGVVNVNMTDRDFYGNEDYYYFDLVIEDGAVTFNRMFGDGTDTFEGNALPGIMHPAFLEDIADYPEEFLGG